MADHDKPNAGQPGTGHAVTGHGRPGQTRTAPGVDKAEPPWQGWTSRNFPTTDKPELSNGGQDGTRHKMDKSELSAA